MVWDKQAYIVHKFVLTVGFFEAALITGGTWARLNNLTWI